MQMGARDMSPDRVVNSAHHAEKNLSIFYCVAAGTSALGFLALKLVWEQWSWTLWICESVQCECILYCVSGWGGFKGGGVGFCRFAVYALLPAILVGTAMAIYHVYRVCVSRDYDEPRIVSGVHKDGQIDGTIYVLSTKPRSPFKQWAALGFISVFIACLSLSQAIVLTDGYYRTCSEGRKHLIHLLGSSTREAEAIDQGLSCSAIFDFLDYVQPDTNNYRRTNYIITSWGLLAALQMSWINFGTWVALAYVNFSMARQRLKSLGEKMCSF